MSKWINFKRLREELLFRDVLAHYKIPFKVKGDRAMAFCPLPNHPQRVNGKPRTASLSIHFGRNLFQCFGCKAKGRAVDFACRMEGFNPADPSEFRAAALKILEIFDAGKKPSRRLDDAAALSEEHPVQSDQLKLKTIINAPLDFELRDLDPEHPYLRERGFSPETIRHFGLGYCNRGLMRGRIAIPLRDRMGELIGYAGRLTKDSMISEECPKYLLPGRRERSGIGYEFHKSLFVYNSHAVESPADDLIVVEGFPSTWWLRQAGYRNVVGLMGSHCSESQAAQICELVTLNGRVWALPDGDEPGTQCAYSIFEKIAPRRSVRRVVISNHHQPTDVPLEDFPLILGAE